MVQTTPLILNCEGFHAVAEGGARPVVEMETAMPMPPISQPLGAGSVSQPRVAVPVMVPEETEVRLKIHWLFGEVMYTGLYMLNVQGTTTGANPVFLTKMLTEAVHLPATSHAPETWTRAWHEAVPVGLGNGVGEGLGEGVGEGVGEGMGEGVGEGVGVGVGVGEATGDGVGSGEGVGALPDTMLMSAQFQNSSGYAPLTPQMPMLPTSWHELVAAEYVGSVISQGGLQLLPVR